MQLWLELHSDLLSIPETWIRPADRFLVPSRSTLLRSPLGQRNRGHVGKALVHRWHISLRTVYKQGEARSQVIIARSGNLWIVLIYLAPSFPPSWIMHTLKMILQISRETTVILGDLNVRHETWDSARNARGWAILIWDSQWAWWILAPS